MRFQNVKPEELEGPIKLAGFSEWAKSLPPGSGAESVLLAAPPGTGKGAAIGCLADALHYDIVRCRLKQLLEYPDPAGEFKAMLQGAEHLHRTVIWLDGLDRFLAEVVRDGDMILNDWLKTEHNLLKKNELIVVGTARQTDALPGAAVDAFDRTFAH